MATIKVRIKNLAQIRQAFTLNPAVMVRELNLAIRKAALGIQAQSQRNTPVDTGRLRASHYTLFGNLRGVVGPDTNYAFFVHDGTKYMRARPYLLNAVESEDNTTQGYFEEAVSKTLDELARGAG